MKSRGRLIEKHKLLKELHRRESKKDFSRFITYVKDDYQIKWFHKVICDKLQSLLDGSLGKKKLMIFLPPQHGKSEISSRQFPAFALGQNPKLKIALCSYADSLATGFNRSIQQIIDSVNYSEVYPDTYLNSTNVSTDTKRGVLRNSSIFETVGHKGYVKTVGVGGGLTGVTVDLGIIDDPFKDRAEARSQTVRNNVWSWYEDVFSTRLHNDSKQLLLFTRWHEDDLAGRLLEREADDWEVVCIQALKEDEKAIESAIEIDDPREIDEALWEEKHSSEKIKKIREFSPITFASLYQQRPKALGGNMVSRDWFEVVKNFDSTGYRTEIYIDGAYTEKTTNDPTAVLHIAYKKDEIIILNSTTVRKQLYELLEWFPKYTETQGFKKSGRVWIEPKASGKSIKSMLKQKGYNAVEIPNKTVSLGKLARVEDCSPSMQAGKVKILKGAWNDSILSELEGFPNAKHDDQVDTLCYAIFQNLINTNKLTMTRIN